MMAIWRWTRLLLLLLMPSFMCFFLGSSLEEDGSGFLNSTNHMYSTEEASLALSHNILTQTPQRFALFQAWGLRHKRPRCKTGNSIDDCWRCDHNWAWNRKRLADCAIGFGRHAIGGKNGEFYMVVDSSDKDPANPKIGTLRHAVIQTEPLWIIFISSMEIRLRQELLVNSYKTIDGRGSNIHISGGPCITVQNAHHVIIHGIHIHDCVPSKKGMIRSSPTHVSWHSPSDGDGIHVYGSYHIWIDHCSLSQCTDGLIDVTHGSTFTTISNNYFTNHDKVMLLGHSDTYVADKKMQVTVAYNHFGKGLVQRMPRCRHGFFEILNNEYIEWKMYAIGGSAQPTINSKGNRFLAPDVKDSKQVTKRMHAPNNVWRSWNWRTQGDLFLNGAYFVQSGSFSSPNYLKAATTGPKPCKWVEAMTTNAGPFDCKEGSSC